MQEDGVIKSVGPEIVSGVSEQVKERARGIQRLLSTRDRASYRRCQQALAQEWGLSVRSVQRLVKRWREQGLSGLMRQAHRNKGEPQTSGEWQGYILQTWRDGNRGGLRLSPAQVYLRVRARAEELGEAGPSRSTVYRLLRPEIAKQQRKEQIGSIGWRGTRLKIRTRGGVEIEVDHSNQVWQADHTKVDVLVVDASGEVLGRPWLTTVVDSYSRCIMGMHLGMEVPSAAVVCLALRHAILAKRYSSGYELSHSWSTYGLPSYLYSDNGKEFCSHHIEQVSNELGIVLCYRRRPSDGGIVERPFGTFNSELFSGLPGYTGRNRQERPKQAEANASLTLSALERLLVRYIVDRYNRNIDARMGDQSRIERWQAGCLAQLPLLGERELDMCLMRRESRTVYRGGYLQFNNLTYLGEHLAGYAGEKVVIRYNPRDITTIWVYQYENGKDHFVTRAHAQDLETEILSVAEAKAISRRLRRKGRLVTNKLLLEEVRWREREVSKSRARSRLSEPESSSVSNVPAAVKPVVKPELAAEEDLDDGVIDYDDIPDVEVRYYDDDPYYRRLGW